MVTLAFLFLAALFSGTSVPPPRAPHFGGSSAGQTPVTNPRLAEFTPSVDHSNLVTRYDLLVYTAGQVNPVITRDLSKPDPVNNLISLPLGSLLSGLSPGEYVARVAA